MEEKTKNFIIVLLSILTIGLTLACGFGYYQLGVVSAQADMLDNVHYASCDALNSCSKTVNAYNKLFRDQYEGLNITVKDIPYLQCSHIR